MVRTLLLAVMGGLAGAVCLAWVAPRPELTFRMDRDLPPRVFSGFYPVEVSAVDAYAWTSGTAQFNVPNVARSVPWRCLISFRGARPGNQEQPEFSVGADGQTLATRRATNEYQVLELVTPVRPSPAALKLAMRVSETFVPGSSDPRELGVQINLLSCRPAGYASQPVTAVMTAALTAGIFGALFGEIGLSTLAACACVAAMAFVQMFPLALGLAPYTGYLERICWAAGWIGCSSLVIVRVAEWRIRHPFSTAAKFVAAFSAAILFVKLLALLHPSKSVVDALFHAHRFEYVLAGRYFFTQEMPGGVQFPYAIALYVTALPFAPITRDYIALLRVVTTVSEAVAGVLLCWAMLRTWPNAVAVCAALVLFHAIPGAFEVMGNANLTNAFGQSAAIAAISVAIGLTTDWRAWQGVALLVALIAVAFLSHVSTFALSGGILAMLAALYCWKGTQSTRRAGMTIGASTLVAALLSVGAYYARPEFMAAYKTAQNARAREIVSESAEGSGLTGGAIPVRSLTNRVTDGLTQAARSVGWPILLLGVIGIWRMHVSAVPERMRFALDAWAIVAAAFVAFGIVVPGGVGHQRQALEFIARAAYAGAPAFVVLAAVGLSWAYRTKLVWAILGSMACVYAIVAAGRVWIGWIR
jgi:hypothetical protein